MTWKQRPVLILRRAFPSAIVFLLVWCNPPNVWSQRPGQLTHGRNYDEAKVRPYRLPDPLAGPDGATIRSANAWVNRRRPQILNDFRDLMYGHTPDLPIELRSEVVAVHEDAVDGLATRKIVRLRFFDDPAAPHIDLMVYIPNDANEPAPAFLGMSFYGNASVESDPRIPLPTGWMRQHPSSAVIENRATEELRGIASERWPLKLIMQHGYALATFYYGDVEPDHLDGWRDGIRGYALERWGHLVRWGDLSRSGDLKRSGNTELANDAWGALGAWAWGLSRSLDYLETVTDVDGKRIAVFGHSRLGKAALWAAVQDERFALAISNNSGEGGASLARRNFGENIAYSIAHASWRYSKRFPEYIGRADELPFDQHMLLALIAPRPLYVSSASEDLLADPKGEFLSALHASPVYQLFGLRGIPRSDWPAPNTPVGDHIGYHVRSGGHDITRYDWKQFLDFADRHIGS